MRWLRRRLLHMDWAGPRLLIFNLANVGGRAQVDRAAVRHRSVPVIALAQA
jgi:hypothetical protein